MLQVSKSSNCIGTMRYSKSGDCGNSIAGSVLIGIVLWTGKDGTVKAIYNNQFDPESHIGKALEAL